MNPLDLARWQFGITTAYHFLFVPLTIGLAFIVAGLQTSWYRTGNERWLRLTRFYGELFLINFALGVVTGIVQEFQFGMNWSQYSRFVGDIFGAPLAIEGLLAFFLESTFLGLWIFGGDRLSKRVHLATIWIAAIGTAISAYIILAANSWMQHPVGYKVNPVSGRAELTDLLAVVLNSTALVTYAHTIACAFLTSGALVAGVALWRMIRQPDGEEGTSFRSAARIGTVMVVVAAVAILVTGDLQARVMTSQQPMKMAAAEALYETKTAAPFSLFTVGTLDGKQETFSIRVPNLLSIMATMSTDGKVEGINDLQAQYTQQFGPNDYIPYVPVTYWSFRLMIGVGFLAFLAALWILWAMRRGNRIALTRFTTLVAVTLPFLPVAANTLGWVFTEMGRQPWIVWGLMPTSTAVSPSTGVAEVLLTLVGFTVLYGILAAIELGLIFRRVRAGLPTVTAPAEQDGRPVSFAY